MSNKLTPETTQSADLIMESIMADQQKIGTPRQYTEGWVDGAAFALTNPELLQAQGLYTREEVREFIKAAVSIGGRNPGIETDAEKVADTILPTPPGS